MHGVIAASATPFDNLGHVDIDRLLNHIQWLLSNGCHGVALFGTTGEANSISLHERINTVSGIRKKISDPEKYLIGTGCCAVDESIELTKQALDHGFNQVLMLPPFYYKNISEDGLVKYFGHVIESVKFPDLKIYLYHFPAMTGVPFTHSLISRLIQLYPGSIAGIKDSSGDLENMKTMCHKFKDFEVFAGTERFLYPVLKEGGVGCISATVNVTVKMARNVYDKWKNGEDATQLQQDLISHRTFLENYPVIPAVKGILSQLYQDKNWLNTLVPHLPLKPDELERLLATDEVKYLLR